jgi:5'-phosphate synthase pdxT subunit
VATSFHPEVTGDPRIHELFLDVVRETAAARDSRTTTSTTD